MKLHIGKEIARVQKLRRVTNDELASKVGTSLRNIFNLKNADDLNISLLYRISEVLKYNFFELFTPVTVAPDEVLKAVAESKPTKTDKKVMTMHLVVKYPVTSTPDVAKFLNHIHTTAEKMGFTIE